MLQRNHLRATEEMTKTCALNMRVEPVQHALRTRAAKRLHQDRTSFVVDAACQRAAEVFLDQRLFQPKSARAVYF